MKAPAFQFYPADWRKDPGIQSLSLNDRGAWFEILCLMHESPRRGVLLLPSGEPMQPKQLARILGVSCDKTNLILKRIQVSGVSSRDQLTGALLCRRMVRDEEISALRRMAGAQGGNPALLKQTVNQDPTTPVNQKPTPSSSPSSSASPSGEKKKKEKASPSPKKQPVPVQLEITEAMREWAHGDGFTDADIQRETPAMLDHFRAKGESRTDWIATWRNWIRNSLKFNRNGNGGSNGIIQNNRESATQARERRNRESTQQLLDVINGPTRPRLGSGGFFGEEGPVS